MGILLIFPLLAFIFPTQTYSSPAKIKDEIGYYSPPPIGVSCTMCSSCDNPCHPLPSPPPPSPPPPKPSPRPPATISDCPPPPPSNYPYASPPPPSNYPYSSPPQPSNYPYSSPPPPSQVIPYTPNFGPPRSPSTVPPFTPNNFPTPPPPNPIVPYFPFYFYNPPHPSSMTSGAALLKPFASSSLILLLFLCFF